MERFTMATGIVVLLVAVLALVAVLVYALMRRRSTPPHGRDDRSEPAIGGNHPDRGGDD